MAKKVSCEEAMGQLEEIVEQLEAGELPLEEAIRAYEKGTALLKVIDGILGDAKRRVTLLTEHGEQTFLEEGEA